MDYNINIINKYINYLLQTLNKFIFNLDLTDVVQNNITGDDFLKQPTGLH